MHGKHPNSVPRLWQEKMGTWTANLFQNILEPCLTLLPVKPSGEPRI